MNTDPTVPLAILNTSIVTAPGDYEVQALTLDAARRIVAEAPEILSAVGHEATAHVLTELLGREVPVNRIQFEQQPGQRALVLKLRGRIPEGQILDVAGMQAIGYDLWLMRRRLDTGDGIQADLDRCQHGRHGRQGRGQPDSCADCPNGLSAGNPVATSTVIGYRIHGEPITVADIVDALACSAAAAQQHRLNAGVAWPSLWASLKGYVEESDEPLDPIALRRFMAELYEQHVRAPRRSAFTAEFGRASA